MKFDSGKCQDILNELVTHNESWPFLEPVDPVAMNIPTYFDEISHPMDFQTIQSNFNKYQTTEAFFADLVLVFDNAIKFNVVDQSSEHSVGAIAIRMKKMVQELYAKYFRLNNSIVEGPATASTGNQDQFTLDAIEWVKKQKLYTQWKSQSFVARHNRIKCQKRRSNELNLMQ